MKFSPFSLWFCFLFVPVFPMVLLADDTIEGQNAALATMSTSEAVSGFTKSADAIEQRKLAKIIGDRSIADNLRLSEPEQAQIKQAVTNILNQAKSPDANSRAEARQQIDRLWHAAVPALIANIATNDAAVAELAIKSLILMRNESIVTELIREAKTTTDEGRRRLLIFALSKMKEQRKSLIQGRQCLGEKESDELYQRVVAPALDELKNAQDQAGKKH